MVELTDILSSGDIQQIKIQGADAVTVATFIDDLTAVLADGIDIPEVESADAANGSLFYDPTAGQYRIKSPAGILLRLRLQLV